MHRLIPAVLFMCAFLSLSREANACSCFVEDVAALPNGPATPRNTRVYVQFREHRWRKKKVVPSIFVRPKGGRAIETQRRDTVSEDVRIAVLTPVGNLRVSTAYEVLVNVTRYGDKLAPGRERVVARFTTGELTDNKAPASPTFAATKYVYREAVCCMCGSSRPHIQLKVGKNTAPMYGVWSGADGKVDWSRGPALYARSYKGTLILGISSMCSAENFPIPTTGTITLGIRAIDLAHNCSPPTIVEVKATPIQRLPKL